MIRNRIKIYDEVRKHCDVSFDNDIQLEVKIKDKLESA